MAKTRVALITGANKGIGYEIARQLGEKGYHVLVGARKAEAGKQAVASLQKSGASAEFIEIDVSDRASIQKAAKTVAAQFDHLDTLVNNAAIMEDKNNITEVPDELLHRTLQTNTFGPLLVTQAFLRLLTKSPQARQWSICPAVLGS